MTAKNYRHFVTEAKHIGKTINGKRFALGSPSNTGWEWSLVRVRPWCRFSSTCGRGSWWLRVWPSAEPCRRNQGRLMPLPWPLCWLVMAAFGCGLRRKA